MSETVLELIVNSDGSFRWHMTDQAGRLLSPKILCAALVHLTRTTLEQAVMGNTPKSDVSVRAVDPALVEKFAKRGRG